VQGHGHRLFSCQAPQPHSSTTQTSVDFTVTVEAGTPLRSCRKLFWKPAGSGLAIDWPWAVRPMARGPARFGGLVARGLAGGALPSATRCARSTDRHRLYANRWGRRHGPAERVVSRNVAATILMRLFHRQLGVPRA